MLLLTFEPDAISFTINDAIRAECLVTLRAAPMRQSGRVMAAVFLHDYRLEVFSFIIARFKP